MIARGLAALALVLAAISAGGVGFSGATLTSSTKNLGNRFNAATDWAPPTITASVVSLTTATGAPTAVAGYVRQGATYRVYANVTDANSGISSVTGGLRSLSGSIAGNVALTQGSYTVAGTTYNYATAQQLASVPLSEGAQTYSITATDAAGNAAGSTSTVTVDNTAPAAADIQTANATGGTNGHPELRDQVTYTFSEPVDPGSILAGWTGAATSVVFRFVNGPQTDSFVVYNASNTAQLPLGSVDSGKKYVTQNISFGATGTPSTMVMSGSTVTITLGTASGNTTTANGAANMKWTSSVTATDRAGNPMTLGTVTEGGTGDLDF